MGLERVLGLCLLLLLVACQPKAVSVPPGTEVIRCFEGAYRVTLERDESGPWVLVLRARPDPSAHWVRWALSVAIPGESTGDANSISGSLTTVVPSSDELILGRVHPLNVKPGQQIVVSFGLDGPGPEGYVFYSESVHLCRLAEGYAILEETRGQGETTMSDMPPELLTPTPRINAPETLSTPKVGRYELVTTLPTDLPDGAMMYSTRPVSDAAGWAQRIADALGFEGEPAYAKRGCHGHEWAWGQAHSSSALTTYADYAFQASDPLAGHTGTGGLKTAEAAIAAARDWLMARDLLPEDCQTLVTASPTNVPAEPRRDIWNPGWEIRFQRVLDSLPVGGFWTSGICLHIWSNGCIGSMTYVHRTVDDQMLCPLRPVAEAWEELQAAGSPTGSGRGPAYFDTDSPLRSRYDVARIEEITLAYREQEVGTAQPHFLPFYAFRGTVCIGDWEDGFIAYVLALREERPVTAPPTPTSPPETIQLVLWALAGQFRVNPAEIELVHWQVVKWPDACLGVPMRAPCSKTITPGYRIILEIGGQPYEYRSNLDGSYFLLAAPEVQIEDPVLIWEGDEPNGCQSLALAADGRAAAIGPCGAPQTPLYLLDDVQRPQQLAYLLARFASFYAETLAGQVTFQGRGKEIATPAWQRAIVTWANLVRQELQFGRSGASWGLALAWHGEGETAGFCDHLQVESYGLAFASTSRCGGGEAQTLGQAWLDTAELEQLYAWQDRLFVFELPGRLVFTGTGSQAATEAEVQAILDWAERLWKRIVANTPRLSDVPAMPCPHTPLGGFYDVWQNEQVRPRLCCPLAPAMAITGEGGFNVNPICSYSTNGSRDVAQRGLCLEW